MRRTTTILPAVLLVTLSSSAQTFAVLPSIRISDDGCGFVLSEPNRPFVPWGFNYDHDPSGRLIEDYWSKEATTIEEDFREMKQLGANVVRIHLQFGKFMDAADQPNEKSLQRLAWLVKLAEKTELYLNVTGLGCYHKKDVPAWYDALDESQRWDAQAVFWSAIARQCNESSAIFCYDLMNEPVVAGGRKPRTDWLGPAFAGKHFVQFITLDAAGRQRHEIARHWIRHLVAAIRKHDRHHLITVGLVPWSLDRPGLTSGFVPSEIADDLDFVSVHIYPKTGKVDESIETVKAFAAAGKPVVIEEIFPLKCPIDDLEEFLNKSRPHVVGWIGFYWGKTPVEYRDAQPKTIADAITLQWLELFQRRSNTMKKQQAETTNE